MSRAHFDIAVIGGGLVGLASAHALAATGLRVVVLEKEARVATHQSGRNSGVLHTGVYYAPGSDKARNCRDGYAKLLGFCRAEDIAHRLCGKVIVACDESEVDRLTGLEERARANGVRCERIEGAALRELEPHVAGEHALHVPDAGIVDFVAVASRLAERLEAFPGCEVQLGANVTAIERDATEWRVRTPEHDVLAGVVVNCAGLHSDRVARLAGADPGLRIVPFRGEYYSLAAEAAFLCRGLIYPVPDPRFPFLGVHLTATLGDEVLCGPNAVLALAREGYRWSDRSASDLAETLRDPGFRRLAARHWRSGLSEMHRSLSKAAFVRALQRLVPDVRSSMLVPARAGVRAQAVSADGALVDDFVVVRGEGLVNVCNAPSPAATACLAIADTVAAHALDALKDRA